MLNVSFVFTGYINGRPSWTSTQYGMEIVWNGTYWEILNWPYDGLPINYTDTNIPLTGWELIDNTSITATFTFNLGECCFDYSFFNNVSSSTLVIDYTDCDYALQSINAGYGVSGSFCATSIQYSSNSGSYSTSGSLCGITPSPSTTPPVSISATPSVTPSITPSVTPSITPSVTPSISVGVSITPSVTPTITPSNTSSITPSLTPSLTATPTPPPTSTPTPTPTLPGPVAITMITFGTDTQLSACADISTGEPLVLLTTRYSTNSYLNPGDIIYDGPGLTNPTTWVTPVYYGYTITPGPLYAWVYVDTDGTVLSGGYCS